MGYTIVLLLLHTSFREGSSVYFDIDVINLTSNIAIIIIFYLSFAGLRNKLIHF